MFRIFISYNNENREIVKTLADDVATLGHQAPARPASSPAAMPGGTSTSITAARTDGQRSRSPGPSAALRHRRRCLPSSGPTRRTDLVTWAN